MTKLLEKSPQEVASWMKERKIQRIFFVYDFKKETLTSSHDSQIPEIEMTARDLENSEKDFSKHEGVFIQLSKYGNSLLGAFLHNTHRGQGQGGTRFWSYDTFGDFLRDGLRLSKGMTRKSALAGLWWGGGKGVISMDPKAQNKDPKLREKIFKEYGEFVTSLKGCYIAAEDVGTNPKDVGDIYSGTRFVTCIPPEIGGSGNPSTATARGVIRGMEAACYFKDGSSLSGKRVAVQGTGHVGEYLIRYLFEKNVGSVIACDINAEKLDEMKRTFQGKPLELTLIQPGDNSILGLDVDIVAPCATGATINSQTIPTIQAKILCGAANNQLEDAARDDKLLHDKGILYVPDYLVNRMGIVQCANEQYGYLEDDPFIERHLGTEWEHSIYQLTLKVLKLSREKNIPPGLSAYQLAEEHAQEDHPLFGHRGAQIIQSLVSQGWAQGWSDPE